MPHALRIFRRDQLATPSALSDAGLLKVATSLSDMLARPCPDDALAAKTGSLLATLGAVTTTTPPLEYVLIEGEPPDPQWKYVCVAGTVFHVDDGGGSPIVVQLEVMVPSPFN